MENATLEVTGVSIYHIKNENSKLKAFAQIILNNALKISGLRVVEGENGLFTAFPDQKNKNGEYFSLVVPLNKEVYQTIREEVIHSYQSAVAEPA